MSFLALGAVDAQGPADYERMGRDVLKELVETDTTHATGSTTIAAERMAVRLLAAGFPKADVQVVRGGEKEAETKGNLVVRYRGKGTRKPILFIAHLDVVAAKREDWTMDPFELDEKDGYFYGRGTQDHKGRAATARSRSFLRLATASSAPPDRDLILALTADEERRPRQRGRAGCSAHRARRSCQAELRASASVRAQAASCSGGKATALSTCRPAEKSLRSPSSVDGDEPGRPQLAAPEADNAICAARQPACRALCTTMRIHRSAVEPTPPDARLLPAHGDAWRRAPSAADLRGRGGADGARGARQPRRRRWPATSPRPQRAPPHDLRRRR